MSLFDRFRRKKQHDMVQLLIQQAELTLQGLHLLQAYMRGLAVPPNSFLERMVSLLTDAAAELHHGVSCLQGRPNLASEHAMRAKALENRVGRVYREAIAYLFSDPRDLDDVIEMLKLREIYRHLSNVADRGDAAANVIADIVVKRVRAVPANLAAAAA